jgi:hypothetical protein
MVMGWKHLTVIPAEVGLALSYEASIYLEVKGYGFLTSSFSFIKAISLTLITH